MKKINENTYGQIIRNLYRHATTGQAMSCAVRITREPEGYRVDVNTGWGPWEAIDGGTPLHTLTAARAVVAQYRRLVKAQRTYQPTGLRVGPVQVCA